MIGVDTTFLVHLEIAEMAEHVRAHELLRREVLDANEELALVPQVLAEFLHVVTDPKRFQKPFTMSHALSRAEFWWNAREVKQVYTTAAATQLLFEWMGRHSLGRKRILDTKLAATLWSAGVRRVLTSNARDFAIFGVFQILSP
jgi:predicted nucleic acid-binding protein